MSNMVVRTNVLALNSHRNLGKVGNQQANASARLSSGFRINSAADDAAGLGISEKMRAQIRGLDQASRNSQDGISLIQTAEGAMSTINEMVVRIRELVVQAANDTNAHVDENEAQSDRVRIQDEINQLMDEIDATRNRTQFNTRNLIDGSLAGAASYMYNADGHNRRIDSLMNSSAVLEAIRNAGDRAVATDSSLSPLRTALNNAITAHQPNEIAYRQAKANEDLQATILTEATNAQKVAQDKYDEIVKLISSNNVTVDDVIADLNAYVSKVQTSFGKAMAELELGMVSGNAFTYTAGNFLDLAVGSGTISSVLDGLSSNSTGAEVAKAFNDIQKAMDSFFNSTNGSNTATWNGVDFSKAFGDPAAGQTAVKTFFGALNDAISDDETSMLRIKLAALTSDSVFINAALSAAAATLSAAMQAVNSAQTELDTLQALTSAAKVAYDVTLAALNSASSAYEAAAAPIRSAAESQAAMDERDRIAEETRKFFEREEREGNEIWFQVGANVDQGVKLGIEDVGTAALSWIGATGQQADKIGEYTFDRLRTVPSGNVIHGPGGEPSYDPTGGVTNASGEEIQNYITAIDEALAHVTGQRSKLGAMQNRLEYTIENVDIASENLSASESRIRDADMAKEMMRLTQANVLQQAATSMLAQANQAPQSVLQLLG